MHSSIVVPEQGDVPPRRLKAPVINQAEKAAQLFKALGDPTRLQILYMLEQNQGAKVCAVDLSDALQVSPPTVTHHMKKLTNTNLVNRYKAGKWTYYELVPEVFKQVSRIIESL